MSSYYFCRDCEKAVDLKKKHEGFGPKRKDLSEMTCKECGGDNWEVRNG